MEKMHYRHGDVMLMKVEDAGLLAKVRDAALAVPLQREVTIAYGEVTGHHHTLYPNAESSIAAVAEGDSYEAPTCGGVKLIEVDGRRFIDVGTEYFLRHQEHKEHRILPGCYEIVMEEEYCPFEKAMRAVVD